jgi:hypothetical protein
MHVIMVAGAEPKRCPGPKSKVRSQELEFAIFPVYRLPSTVYRLPGHRFGSAPATGSNEIHELR